MSCPILVNKIYKSDFVYTQSILSESKMYNFCENKMLACGWINVPLLCNVTYLCKDEKKTYLVWPVFIKMYKIIII